MSSLERFKKIADLESQIKILDQEFLDKLQATEKKFLESNKEEVASFFEKEGFKVDSSVKDTVKISYADKSLLVYFDPEHYMGCWFLIKASLLSLDQTIGKFEISVDKQKIKPGSKIVAKELSNDADKVLELENRINQLKRNIAEYTEPTFLFSLRDVTYNSSDKELLNNSTSITEVLVTILNK